MRGRKILYLAEYPISFEAYFSTCTRSCLVASTVEKTGNQAAGGIPLPPNICNMLCVTTNALGAT